MHTKLPVTVLRGFLGSGKTTLFVKFSTTIKYFKKPITSFFPVQVDTIYQVTGFDLVILFPHLHSAPYCKNNHLFQILKIHNNYASYKFFISKSNNVAFTALNL